MNTTMTPVNTITLDGKTTVSNLETSERFEVWDDKKARMQLLTLRKDYADKACTIYEQMMFAQVSPTKREWMKANLEQMKAQESKIAESTNEIILNLMVREDLLQKRVAELSSKLDWLLSHYK